jgi:hypothetical protein
MTASASTAGLSVDEWLMKTRNGQLPSLSNRRLQAIGFARTMPDRHGYTGPSALHSATVGPVRKTCDYLVDTTR